MSNENLDKICVLGAKDNGEAYNLSKKLIPGLDAVLDNYIVGTCFSWSFSLSQSSHPDYKPNFKHVYAPSSLIEGGQMLSSAGGFCHFRGAKTDIAEADIIFIIASGTRREDFLEEVAKLNSANGIKKTTKIYVLSNSNSDFRMSSGDIHLKVSSLEKKFREAVGQSPINAVEPFPIESLRQTSSSSSSFSREASSFSYKKCMGIPLFSTGLAAIVASGVVYTLISIGILTCPPTIALALLVVGALMTAAGTPLICSSSKPSY